MASPSDGKGGADSSEKPPPVDWGKVFTEIVCHTSIGYFDIPEMTIPQIEATRNELGPNISLKIGGQNLFGGSLEAPTPSENNTGKPPKLSQFMDLANAFNGI